LAIGITLTVILSSPALSVPQGEPAAGCVRFHNRTVSEPDANYVPITLHELPDSYPSAKDGKSENTYAETGSGRIRGSTIHDSSVAIDEPLVIEAPLPSPAARKKTSSSLLQTKADKSADDTALSPNAAKTILRSSTLFPQERASDDSGEGWLAAAVERQRQEAANAAITPGSRDRTIWSGDRFSELPNADSYQSEPVGKSRPTSIFDRSQPAFPSPYASHGLQSGLSTPIFDFKPAPPIDLNLGGSGSMTAPKNRKPDVWGAPPAIKP
jgi:hypothetical protein